MTAQELHRIISQGMPCTHLEVDGDGRHWQALVVSSEFEGLRRIQRHQRVYATLGDRMATDEVHALSIKAMTPEEYSAAATE